MDNTITYKVRALSQLSDSNIKIEKDQILEVNDDDPWYYHPVGYPSTCGFRKNCFEVIEDETEGDVWTTP